MGKIKDLYDLIPEGMFSSQEELEESINSEGIEGVYDLIPEGMFSNREEFMSEFGVLKKKVENLLSNGEEVVTDGIIPTETVPGSSDSLDVNQTEDLGIIGSDEVEEILNEDVKSSREYVNDLLQLAESPTREHFYKGGRDYTTDLPENIELINQIKNDFNIQKSLERGIITQVDIDKALNGDVKYIKKLQGIATESNEQIQKRILEGDFNNPHAYEASSDLNAAIIDPQDEIDKLEAIEAIKAFDLESKRLLKLNPNVTGDERNEIFSREGSPTEEQYRIVEVFNRSKTRFEDSDIDSMYNTDKLSRIDGFNIKDFDGILNEQGYKEDYKKITEDFTEEGYDDWNQFSPALARENLKLGYLTNYINKQVERNVESQVLNYKLKHDGRHPSLDGVKISFDSGVDSEGLTKYIEDEFPFITGKLKAQDVKNQELYQQYKEGEDPWAYQSMEQGWRSIEDRIGSFTAGVYDWVGVDSVTDNIRLHNSEVELNRGDFLRYTYTSGKSANVGGINYLMDDKNQIYDLNSKIRVTDVLSQLESEEIYKAIGERGVDDWSYSQAGMTVTTAGVASDMLFQIALTRGVAVSGQGVKALGQGLTGLKSGGKAINLISQVPIKASTASAMIAQGTLFSTNLSEQTYQQALDAGMSIKDSEELSAIAGIQGFALGTLTAPLSTQTYALNKIFGKNANDLLIKGATNAYVKGGKQGAITFWKKAQQKVTEYGAVYGREGGKEVFQENVQQAGQAYVIGENINELAGKEIMANTISGDEFVNTTIISAAAGILMPFGGSIISGVKTSYNNKYRPGVSAIDRMKLLDVISRDVKKTTDLLNSQVTKGVYTEEQVKNVLSDIEIYRNTINSVPKNLTPETALSVMSDINEINKQKQLKEQVDEAFHPDIDAKIAEIRNGMVKKTNFDYLSEDVKSELKLKAMTEISNEEFSEKGSSSINSEDSQVLFRAVEDFSKLPIEEQQKLAGIKTEKDAISKPSTEKQVLPDAEGSTEKGTDTEVGLQQVGEGDVKSESTKTETQEGKTETDTTSDTTQESDVEQVVETEVMSVNNKIESFANRIVKDGSEEFSDEAITFYEENKESIDKLVTEKKKDIPKEESKERSLAIKISRGDTDFSDADIDLYASSEEAVNNDVEAIAKTNSQTVTKDTYKDILKSTKSTTRTDKAKVEGENAQRKRFWASWRKSARLSKLDLKGKRKDLNNIIQAYAKGKKGTISSAQTKAVINRVNKVNLDNPTQVQALIEYSEKVFGNADFNYDIDKANNLIAKTRKKLNSGRLGINPEFNTAVSALLTNPVADLSPKDVKILNDFLSKIAKKETVTKLDTELINEANSILESILSKQEDVESELIYDEDKGFVYKEGTQKIIDKINNPEITGETLIEENSEFIENNLDKLDSSSLEILVDKINLAENKENSEIVESVNNYAEKRQSLINTVAKKSKDTKINKLPKTARDQSVGAITLTNLKPAQLGFLSGTSLGQLELHLDNMAEGFYTHSANKLAQRIESTDRAYKIKPIVDGLMNISNKLATVRSRSVAALKNAVLSTNLTGSQSAKAVGIVGQMVRSNPLSVIDHMFGNYTKNTIRENVFDPISTQHAKFKNWINDKTNKLDQVESLIAPTKTEGVNQSINRRFEITTYLIQKEFEASGGKKGTAPSIDFINKTIAQYRLDKKTSNYTDNDIKILNDIVEKYSEGDQISIKKMEEGMSPKTKKAIKILEDVYSGLGELQTYATTIVRGDALDLVNSYVHHKIEYNSTVDKDDTQLISQSNYLNIKPGSKSKVSIKRTEGAKAIDFDPISTALRGVRNAGMDYFLSNEISTGRQTLAKVKSIVEKNDEVEEAAMDLEKVYNESLQNVISSNMSTEVLGGKFFDAARKIGYYATLASVPRAAAEFTSNLTFAYMSTPLEATLGMTKYAKLSYNESGRLVVENLGSKSNTKLYNDEQLGGSKAESGGVTRNKKPTKRAKGTVGQATEYISRMSGAKKGVRAVEKIGEFLISTPDQMISRPLFFGTLAKEFKAITGKKIDMDKIADNDEQYMRDNSEALKKATSKADQNVTQAATSNDPFSGVLKNQVKDGESAMNFYRMVNSYMSSFSLNEYATARQAVASLAGRGQMGRIKAAGTLAGVMARMSLYVVLYKALANSMYAMIGIGGDDDEDYEELALRQSVGAGVSLISRAMSGNIPMIPINMGIEYINKEFGHEYGIREDKEYDAFKHSIIFSSITGDQLSQNPWKAAIKTAAGPFTPQVTSGMRISELAIRSIMNKTKKSREENLSELLSARTALEISNMFGGVPLYKDIRAGFIREKYKKDPVSFVPFSLQELKEYDIDEYNNQMELQKNMEKDPEYIKMKEELKKMEKEMEN